MLNRVYVAVKSSYQSSVCAAIEIVFCCSESCNFVPVNIEFMAVNDRVFCAAVKLVLLLLKSTFFCSFLLSKSVCVPVMDQVFLVRLLKSSVFIPVKIEFLPLRIECLCCC